MFGRVVHIISIKNGAIVTKIELYLGVRLLKKMTQNPTFAQNFLKLKTPVSITGLSSLSPLGFDLQDIWKAYLSDQHFISQFNYKGNQDPVSKLPVSARKSIDDLKKENQQYKDLDDSVLFAISASRRAVEQAGWRNDTDFGVNIGSSRGATGLFEKYFEEFLHKNKASTLSSPTTTLGNISSWVAQDLKTKGPEISHSITCSTALHAVLNGIAWLKSGFTDKFLVGGSEAPLTPFTIAQMKALKIYADSGVNDYPCQAMNLQKQRNSMFLGEGAGAICLEDGIRDNAIALIAGVGYATEPLKHNISISANANCFQDSMKMALGSLDPDSIDVVVMHAPGTIKGDQSEYNAIREVFKNQTPAVTTNKWKIGHTFGASGILSLELAVLMIKYQKFIKIPYLKNQKEPKNIDSILINAVGFGGNAVSILVKKRNEN